MIRCVEKVVLDLGKWVQVESVETSTKLGVKIMCVIVVRAPGFKEAYERCKARAKDIIILKGHRKRQIEAEVESPKYQVDQFNPEDLLDDDDEKSLDVDQLVQNVIAIQRQQTTRIRDRKFATCALEDFK